MIFRQQKPETEDFSVFNHYFFKNRIIQTRFRKDQTICYLQSDSRNGLFQSQINQFSTINFVIFCKVEFPVKRSADECFCIYSKLFRVNMFQATYSNQIRFIHKCFQRTDPDLPVTGKIITFRMKHIAGSILIDQDNPDMRKSLIDCVLFAEISGPEPYPGSLHSRLPSMPLMETA